MPSKETNELLVKIGCNAENLQSELNKQKTNLNKFASETKLTGLKVKELGADFDNLSDHTKNLNKQIEAQKQQVEMLHAKYKVKLDDSKEDAAVTKKAETAWNNARASLIKLEGELKRTQEATQKLSKENGNVEGETRKASGGVDKLSDTMGLAKAGVIGFAAAIGTKVVTSVVDATKKIVGLSLSISKNLNDSMDGFRIKTGANAESTAKFKDELLSIYKSGAGESMDDVADALTRVKSVLKGSDQDTEKFTKATIKLNKHMGYDYNETLRTVSSLTKNFGITSEEAFDTIIKGYQETGDTSGDLLDTLNEYGDSISSIGYNSKDFLNLLTQGTKAGARNLDVVADSIREVGTSLKQMDKPAKEAIEALGLNAKSIQDRVNQGGETARKAIDEVREKIAGVSDETTKNMVLSGLARSLYEDNGAKIAQSVLGIKGSVVETNGAMQNMLDIKTDSPQQQLENLKRKFETEILLPLGQQIMPALERFVRYMVENMPKIEDALKKVSDRMGDVAHGVDWGTVASAIDGFVRVGCASLKMLELQLRAVKFGVDAIKFAIDAVKNNFDYVTNMASKIPKSPLGLLPGFAVGTNYVPRDMVAMVHEGERIVPKSDNPYANPYTSETKNNNIVIQNMYVTDSGSNERNLAQLRFLSSW